MLKALKVSGILDALSLTEFEFIFSCFEGGINPLFPLPFPDVRTGAALIEEALPSASSWEKL